ncbi:MAG: hypothetical protein COV74_05600 [Candidatus Omnitrophica bacterium CG11_big_fil_rev_8_21_14_0_20_45_26]|uniref:Prepilin-type N-terminal cleavage/methylation domain-containing protein n=1 Tax=Candidatus Abzuiibacterium crystallinum TaxID=1974748 RepID=A0A2H0LR53_9BACT|nr:MAG: hypothetical protein COV74_05600 [Candidatus Omnitrophica bacterium CG11_big_fil_rev_8_21_14_0_20_45_26]PIW65276.1 MAG: hypothetical protein COW12_02760 [Candidatus Omnitrophica bacterium CG12_big_fil_rev_8_21_14_0_65_45_16]
MSEENLVMHLSRKADEAKSNMCHLRGALLLEVLIAVTVLSIGILSCLHIFSAALFANQHMAAQRRVQAVMDQVMYPWFLDPTSFGGAGTLSGDAMGQTDQVFRFYVTTESLALPPEEGESGEEEQKGEKKKKIPVQGLSDVEFFKSVFLAQKSNGKPYDEFETYLFRYGKPKQPVS